MPHSPVFAPKFKIGTNAIMPNYSGGLHVENNVLIGVDNYPDEALHVEGHEILKGGDRYIYTDTAGSYGYDLIVTAGWGGCFEENTEIQTPSGFTLIKDLQVDDVVVSYNIETSTETISTVVGSSSRTAPSHYVINGTIKVTGEHPIHTLRGEVIVKELTTSDELFDGTSWIPITSIEKSEIPLRVYNLSVAEPNTYFAGGILAHNKDTSSRPGGQMYVIGGPGSYGGTDGDTHLGYDGFSADGYVIVSNAYYLPKVDGTVDQVLKTDGLGTLSWQTDVVGYWTQTAGVLHPTTSTDSVGLATGESINFDYGVSTKSLLYSTPNTRFEFNTDLYTAGNFMLDDDKKILFNTAQNIALSWNSVSSRLELAKSGLWIDGTLDFEDGNGIDFNAAATAKTLKWESVPAYFVFNDDVFTGGQWLGDGSGLSNIVTSFNTRTGAVTPQTNDYTWVQIDKTTSDIADITTKQHSDLTNLAWSVSGHTWDSALTYVGANPSYIYGGDTTGDDLQIYANNVDATPHIGLFGNGGIYLYAPNIELQLTDKNITIEAINNSSTDALTIKIDSDVITTGKAINVLSGPSFDTTVFNVDEDGNVVMSGTATIGAYTLPNTDGTINQVLLTNGSGVVSWGAIPAPSGFDVTAGSNKITLGGTPTTAALSAFSIDVNEANLNLANLGTKNHSDLNQLTWATAGHTIAGDTAVDFNAGGTAKTLKYDTTATEFQFNDDVYTSGDLMIIDNKMLYLDTAKSGGFSYNSSDNQIVCEGYDYKVKADTYLNRDVYMESDKKLYLDSAKTKYLYWNASNSRFEFNDTVYAPAFVTDATKNKSWFLARFLQTTGTATATLGLDTTTRRIYNRFNQTSGGSQSGTALERCVACQDMVGFQTNPIRIYTRTNDITTNFTITVYINGVVDVTLNGTVFNNTIVNTWQQSTFTPGSAISAGDYINFEVGWTGNSNGDNGDLADLEVFYTASIF